MDSNSSGCFTTLAIIGGVIFVLSLLVSLISDINLLGIIFNM